MCSYTSSDNSTMSVSRSRLASSRMSPSVSIAPEGLCGLLIISMRVRGDIASRNRCQSTVKSCGSSGTCTAMPPARSIAGS